MHPSDPSEIADRAEVELGIDDRADGAYLGARDLERQHAQHPALAVEHESCRTAVDSAGRSDVPSIREPSLTQLRSVRATLLRPRSERASAGTLPPPSPVSTTSSANSFSSPATSPSLTAAKKRSAHRCRCSRDFESAACAPRRGAWRGSPAVGRRARSCPGSVRSRCSHSRTRRAAGTPLAARRRCSSTTSRASESESAISAFWAGSAKSSVMIGSGNHSPT